MAQLSVTAVDSGHAQPWADEFERGHRTPACLRNAHADCPHMMYGFGGGLNPRRLRLEVGAGLCKCDCHSSCPVTSKRVTVSAQAWRESCICAGAEAERIRHDQAGTEFPDFGELRASSRQRSQSRREAFQAARASAAGKSREEIKALHIAELRGRGLEIPPEEILDAGVDALTGNCVTSVRLLGVGRSPTSGNFSAHSARLTDFQLALSPGAYASGGGLGLQDGRRDLA